mgnify:CR=1 FL=1
MQTEKQLLCLVLFVAVCTLGYVLTTNKTQISNENEGDPRGNYFFINKILLTIKEIMNQSPNNSQKPENTPNIHKANIFINVSRQVYFTPRNF